MTRARADVREAQPFEKFFDVALVQVEGAVGMTRVRVGDARRREASLGEPACGSDGRCRRARVHSGKK